MRTRCIAVVRFRCRRGVADISGEGPMWLAVLLVPVDAQGYAREFFNFCPGVSPASDAYVCVIEIPLWWHRR